MTEFAKNFNNSITTAFKLVYDKMLKKCTGRQVVLPVAQTTPATKSLREQVVVAAPD